MRLSPDLNGGSLCRIAMFIICEQALLLSEYSSPYLEAEASAPVKTFGLTTSVPSILRAICVFCFTH